MSANNVLRLGEYRDRRAQRLRLQASLCQTDRGRAALLAHLADLTRITGSDRSAIVWVDEYGPGLVHPHVVLDLASDRPRRSFAMEPLRRAWDTGVPGVFCQAEAPGACPGRSPWTVAVALGSDGSRAWFLVADALAPRARLTPLQRERILFLAGECSAVVLHRDLDLPAGDAPEDGAKPGFAGWPILKDIEGREGDGQESRLIALRFIVARLPRLLLEDELTVSPDRLREQAERARDEIRGQLQGSENHEEPLWERVLEAFQEGDLESLALRIVALGEAAESGGHLYSAAELYRTAFEIAAATGSVDTAVDAARFTGRALRRRASWSEAYHWYGVARGVAEAAGMDARVAVVLDGMAHTQRARGNFPAARATLNEALPIAARSGDARAVGSVYHGLMTLEHLAGNLDRALRCGWRAARTYDRDDDRVYALASLGGVLIDAGHLGAAEDAWTVVARMTDHRYYRTFACEALAYIAALRGDEALFAQRAAECDALGWNTGAAVAKAEVLLHRGLGYRAIGRLESARSWLERAVAFADEHGFGQTLFQAEEALARLELHEPPVEDPQVEPTTSFEVGAGLKALREEWTVATPG